MNYPGYPEYQKTGIKWIGQIPTHWGAHRLKWSVTDCSNGVWGNEPDGVDDVVCVRVADFNRDTLSVNTDSLTLRAVDASQLETRKLQRGDLLIEKSGGGEKQLVGCVVYFDHDFDAVCSNFVARMPVKPEFSARFWSYVHAGLYAGKLNYPAIKQSTGIQNLDASEYLNTLAAYPPPDEQYQIAAFLDWKTGQIDALIAKKQALMDKLKEKRLAVITQAVTKGLSPTTPMRDSGIAWLGAIPEHWDVRRARFTMLVNPPSPQLRSLKPEDEISFIPMDAVGVQGGLRLDQTRVLADVSGGYTEFQNGDVLVAKITPCFENGKAALASGLLNGAAFGTTELHVLRAQKILDRRFLFYVTISDIFSKLGESEMYGAGGQKRVPPEFVSNFLLPLPPVPEQTTIANHIDTEMLHLDMLAANVQSAIAHLTEYRTALITAATTGQIDVRQVIVPASARQLPKQDLSVHCPDDMMRSLP